VTRGKSVKPFKYTFNEIYFTVYLFEIMRPTRALEVKCVENNEATMMIVKFCLVLIIGVVILSSVVSTDNIQSTKQVSLPFSGQPSSGDTVTLDNHIFEFTSTGSVSSGHIPVMIGANEEATKANFRDAISANSNYVVN
jgi:hypothetical protein